MADILLLRSLGIMVVAAAAVVLATRKLHVPSIVAYLLAGLLLGPVLGILRSTEETETIAEVGVILLLFLVGLEVSISKIRAVGRVAVVAGLGQVAVTAVIGTGIAWGLGFEVTEAVFLGTAITFSSTVVAVKLLTEKGELDSLYGRIAIGILLVQDIVVIVLLTILPGLGGAGELSLLATAGSILSAFAGLAVLLVFTLVTARYLLPRLFAWVAGSLEALFIWSLSWCFLLVVGAEMLHLSLEIGGFLAGLGLAQLPYSEELRRRVRPLMNFFIAIFFTTLGMRMELGATLDLWFPALVLALSVLIGKWLLFVWFNSRMGYDRRTSFLAGVTLSQISEFSFIFAALGITTGLIGDEVLSVVALVGLGTIAVSAYMIRYNHELFKRFKNSWLMKLFPDHAKDSDAEGAELLKGHIIIVGMNALGLRLTEELAARGETVLAIDTDPSKLEGLAVETILGSVDHPSVLDEANFGEAKLVVSALQIEDTNNLLAYRCRSMGIPCSIHAFDRSVIEELREIGVTHLMIPKNNGIKRVLGEMRDRGFLGT